MSVRPVTKKRWNEKKLYVLPAADGMPLAFAKDFHVSPLQEMDITYYWTLSNFLLEEKLNILSESRDNKTGEIFFRAGVHMTLDKRYAWYKSTFQTWAILWWIHLHAGITYAKGAAYVKHPFQASLITLYDVVHHVFIFVGSIAHGSISFLRKAGNFFFYPKIPKKK